MNLQLIIIFAKFCVLKAILVTIIASQSRHERSLPLAGDQTVKQEQELDLLVKIQAFGGGLSPSHMLKKRATQSGGGGDELYLYKVGPAGGPASEKDELLAVDLSPGARVTTTPSATTTANAKDAMMLDPDFLVTLHNEGYYTISGDYLDGREANVTNSAARRTMSSAPVSADVAFHRGYCLGTFHQPPMFNWLCKGPRMERVPIGLPNVISLRLAKTGFHQLNSSALVIYKETLRDFSMEHSPALRRIEPGAFNELRKLRVIYILDAPLLTSFDRALNGSYPNLKIIRIELTGLRTWPNLELFRQDKTLTSMDLDSNEIASLGETPLNISTASLNLDHNQIRYIHEHTFSGSEIGELSFKGNRQLGAIHERAFASTRNLIKLDLSDTAISSLPTAGLDELRLLILMGTHQLLKMPSIYGFPKLETALLHYSYHCCSFRYHNLHDPSAYHEFQLLQMETNRLCPPDNAGATPRGPAAPPHHANASAHAAQPKESSSSDFEGFFSEKGPLGEGELVAGAQTSPSTPQKNQIASDDHENNMKTPITGDKGAANLEEPPEPDKNLEDMVATSSAGRKLLNKLLIGNVECGQLAQLATVPNVSCTPPPDAFNPCEDIMGYPILRVAVWLVAGASLFGNLSVIIVLASVFQRLSVPKFLQLNLAIGDLFMGVYLAMLALADITTVGSYFNYALAWQHGFGCKIAGAASLFASQLSIYTLTVITFERYYTITYSIDLNMRLQLGPAARIMLTGWLFAFVSAMLPIFADVSSYSKTSICLPLRTSSFQDQVFLYLLLFVDSSAFVIIFACYLRMYLLIVGQKTQANMKERTIAARMALLVFTDFACWFPIIFFGATALWGSPLINVTDSKILIVFFYPLNSMANPFLYVISTRQYRRDLTYLAGRWHTWRRNLFRFGNRLDSPNYYNQGQLHVMMNQAPATAVCLANAAAQSGPGQSLRPAHVNRQLRLVHLQQQQQQQQHQNNHHPKVLVSSQSGRYLIGHEVQPAPGTELIEMASTLVHPPDSRATGSGGPSSGAGGGTCTQPRRAEPLGNALELLAPPPELPAPPPQSKPRAVCCCCSRQASMSPGQMDCSRATQEQRLTLADSSSGPNQPPPVHLQTLAVTSSRPQQKVKASDEDSAGAPKKKGQAKRRCSCLAVDDIFVDSLREFQHRLNLPKPAPCPKHNRPVRANSIAVDPREALRERERERQRDNKVVDILGNLTHNYGSNDNMDPDDSREQPHRCKSCNRQLGGCDQGNSSTGCQHPHRRRYHHHHHHHHHHRQHHQHDTIAQDRTINTSTSGNQSHSPAGCCHQQQRCRRLHQPEPLSGVASATSAGDKRGQQQQRAIATVNRNRQRRTHRQEKCCPTDVECSNLGASSSNLPGIGQLNGPPAVVIQIGPDGDDVGQPVAKGPNASDNPNNSQPNDLKLSRDRLEPFNQDHRHHRAHHHHHRRHHHRHGRRTTQKHKYHEACLVETLTEKQREPADDQLQLGADNQMVVLVRPPPPPPQLTNTAGGVIINRRPILKRQSTGTLVSDSSVPRESATKVLKLIRTGSLQLLSSTVGTRKAKKRVSIVTAEAEVIVPSN